MVSLIAVFLCRRMCREVCVCVFVCVCERETEGERVFNLGLFEKPEVILTVRTYRETDCVSAG